MTTISILSIQWQMLYLPRASEHVQPELVTSGMANFALIVNTRGCIYTYPDGIVLRSTYHVFDLYVNYLGISCWIRGRKKYLVKQMKRIDG